MGIQAITLAVLVGLPGLLSACASTDQVTSGLAGRSGAPWARDLNEPPSGRQPAETAISDIKADLNAARAKPSR